MCVFNANERLIGYGEANIPSNPMSLWYSSKFLFNGHEWPNAKTAIMYTKAIFYGDYENATKIFKNRFKLKPINFKKFNLWGKTYWFEKLDETLPLILFEKFSQNELLKKWLLATGNSVLAQIAREDKQLNVIASNPIWGITIGPSHSDINNPEKWQKYGKNILGINLMFVRDKLRRNETLSLADII